MENIFNTIRKLFTSRKTLLTTVVGTGGYVTYTDMHRYPQMMDRFSHGNILVPYKDNKYKTCYHKRPELEEKLKYILGPEFTNEYYLVKGEVGTGKSRTIMEIVQEMIKDTGEKGEGAPIYVSVTQQKEFSDTLGKAVSFKFDEHINFKFYLQYAMNIDRFPKRDEHQKLRRVMYGIECAANHYVHKYGRPLVIIIDGVDVLSDHIPGALEKIQEKAKLWADSNICKIVLVSNEESTENFLKKSDSCWSRAGAPIFVGDLSKKETISYLQKDGYLEDVPINCCMTEEDAERIYNLVGGRIQYLAICKRDFVRGIPFKVTSQNMKEKEQEKFVRVTKNPEDWKVIDILLKAPSMTASLSSLITATSMQSVDHLTNENILKLVRGKCGTLVKFESRLAEHTVEEMFTKFNPEA